MREYSIESYLKRRPLVWLLAYIRAHDIPRKGVTGRPEATKRVFLNRLERQALADDVEKLKKRELALLGILLAANGAKTWKDLESLAGIKKGNTSGGSFSGPDALKALSKLEGLGLVHLKVMARGMPGELAVFAELKKPLEELFWGEKPKRAELGCRERVEAVRDRDMMLGLLAFAALARKNDGLSVTEAGNLTKKDRDTLAGVLNEKKRAWVGTIAKTAQNIGITRQLKDRLKLSPREAESFFARPRSDAANHLQNILEMPLSDPERQGAALVMELAESMKGDGNTGWLLFDDAVRYLLHSHLGRSGRKAASVSNADAIWNTLSLTHTSLGIVEMGESLGGKRCLRAAGAGFEPGKSNDSGELLVITPSGEINYLGSPDTFDFSLVYTLSGFADIEAVDWNCIRFKITKNSVLRGSLAGAESEWIVKFLEKRSKEKLSQGLAYSIRSWEEAARRVRLYHAIIVKTSEEKHMEKLLKNPATRECLEKTGPNTAEVSGSLSEFLEALESSEIVPRGAVTISTIPASRGISEGARRGKRLLPILLTEEEAAGLLAIISRAVEDGTGEGDTGEKLLLKLERAASPELWEDLKSVVEYSLSNK